MVDSACQTKITFAHICKDDNIANTPDPATMGVYATWAVFANAHEVKDRLPPNTSSVAAAAPILKADLQSLMQLGQRRRGGVHSSEEMGGEEMGVATQGTQTVASFSYLPRADQKVPLPFLGMLGLQHLLLKARQAGPGFKQQLQQHANILRQQRGATQHKIVRKKIQKQQNSNDKVKRRRRGRPPLPP